VATTVIIEVRVNWKGMTMTSIYTLERPLMAPKLYTTETQERQAVLAYAHYFVGSADWYVLEYDPQNDICFGYARIIKGCGEYGYFSMKELESLRVKTPISIGGITTSYNSLVEFDKYWHPSPIILIIENLD
jgi:hypothetical protein